MRRTTASSCPKHPEGKDTFQPYWADAADDIQNRAWGRAKELYGDPLPEIVQKRLEKELGSIGYAGRATLLAAARQGLFLIPAVFLLSHFFGLTGLELSQAVSDLLSFLLSVPVTLTVLRQFQQSK